MEIVDPYIQVFNALVENGQQSVPFQTLTHIEIRSISHDGSAYAILHYEDLVTGEKKTINSNFRMGRPNTVWNPFTNKGPYFLNSVERIISVFRRAMMGVED